MVINLDVGNHEVYAALANNAILEGEEETLIIPQTRIRVLRITDEYEEDENLIWILGSEDGTTFSICLEITIDGKKYVDDEILSKLQINTKLDL